MTSNNALVPDPDKQDDLASKPWQWPLLNVVLRMCGWDDNTVKYFLLGNPLVYWGSTFSLVFLMALTGWYTLRWQRGYVELTMSEVDHFHYAGLYPLLGWFLHYLPFVAMARVTYVHHYYPALFFAILCAGFCLDWVTRPLPNTARWGLYAFMYAATVGLYVYFRAISFGMVGSAEQWRHLKWLDSWRMVDNKP